MEVLVNLKWYERLYYRLVGKTVRVDLIDSMKVLDVHESDIIVLMIKRKISKNTHESIKQGMEKFLEEFGMKNKVLILEEDIKLGVIRNDKTTSTETSLR